MNLEPSSPLTALAVVAAIIAIAMQLGLAEPRRSDHAAAGTPAAAPAPMVRQAA